MKSAIKTFAEKVAPLGGIAVGSVALPSLTGAADAFLALTLTQGAKSAKLVMAITPGLPAADRLTDDLQLLTAKSPTRILEFPPLIDDDKSALGLRLKTIAAIKAWSMKPYPCIVVASYPALASGLSGMSIAPEATLHLRIGGVNQPAFAALIGKLAEIGYSRVPMVEKEGDFSVRGGILDVWSPGEEFPIRAEYFGDELEGLRTFEPSTQLSVERVNEAEFLPIKVTAEPADCATPKSLMALLPEGAILLALEHNEYSLATLAGERDLLKNAVFTGEPAPAKVRAYNFITSPLPGFSELGADEAHHLELFEAARKRLDQHLTAAERRGTEVVRIDGLSGGFETEGLIVVTKADRVFTKRQAHVRTKSASNQGARISDFDDLEPGEYVVHIDYGVGRYIGSSEIVGSDGKRTEVFSIEYADGGKLHVPAAHAHLLSRYVGVKGEAVRLHRLDGKRWEKDKKDAQKAVSDLAAALLTTQAKRETTPGFAYDVNCDGFDAFEAAFPYEETPDQLAAIAAIKGDMANSKPMDRLICGDAGYGKTEVAMRAAYIAAMNGKQVAVLAPTTVLAEQHYETFISRFDGTPIRIEPMSRFQSTLAHKGTCQRVLNGACDIVIGTHAILSSKLNFHDLGLIIIDEEQRFGVRHKEHLKRLRATADVLTLSATPIPRTLYLSMTGARDLSLLRSPPRERVAVDTKIVTDSDPIVTAAIEAELERGGQVFFLHNRVTTIGRLEKRLNALVPKARVVVAHGQMDTRTLARKMRDFERGDYDILLSTTIVESGIDIPRANTILVDHAEMFGLSDLYQLRGRVGRSSKQGHAVFLLPGAGLVDSDARERLNALKRHGGLGSGFNLAVRDLELRGVGNLLGSQQSGHIASVGFGLYCQLLKRTIALMKGEKVREIVDTKLNLDFAQPRIPYDYIEEESQRLGIMKRFAEAQDSREIKRLADELKDRFGPMPPEVATFVRIAGLRVACAVAGIGRLDVRDERAVYYRRNSAEVAYVQTLRGKTAERKLAEISGCVRSARWQ